MGLKLKYIDLQNFQGYKRARIPLTDFTIVVGLSSSGKTTIFRAMQFLLYGEWDATYPNDPSASTAVAVEFENGTRVLRIRKESQNQAAIIRDGETTKFKSFGSIIPGIQAIINANPIEIGAKPVNLNFSLQDDPTFMVSETRPTKAQWIGRLYGAHIINQMLREMAKDKKNTEARRKEAVERLQGLESEYRAYATIGEQEAILEEVKALLVSYNFLKECVLEVAVLGVQKDSYNRDLWVTKVNTRDLRQALGDLGALLLLKGEVSEFKTKVAEHKKLSRLADVDAAEIRNNLQRFEELMLVKADVCRITLNKTEFRLERTQLALELDKARKQLDESVLSGNSCPVCGNGLKDGDHKHILSNIARLVGSKHNAD